MQKTVALVFVVLAGGFSAAAALQEPPLSVLSGVFSEAQAKRGEGTFEASCAGCHGPDLISVDAETPSLTGPRFKSGWMGKTVGERFELIRTTMPATNPGSLDDQTNIDILAFILKFNGYPAGEQELGVDVKILEKIAIEPVPAGAAAR